MINTVCMNGRLTRDADMQYTNSGMCIVKGSIANSTGWGDKKKTHFFDFVIFGKRAESLHKYLIKGKEIIITGQLNQERWEKDGKQNSRVNVIVNMIELSGGSKKEDKDQVQAVDDSFVDDIPFGDK